MIAYKKNLISSSKAGYSIKGVPPLQLCCYLPDTAFSFIFLIFTLFLCSQFFITISFTCFFWLSIFALFFPFILTKFDYLPSPLFSLTLFSFLLPQAYFSPLFTLLYIVLPSFTSHILFILFSTDLPHKVIFKI